MFVDSWRRNRYISNVLFAGRHQLPELFQKLDYLRSILRHVSQFFQLRLQIRRHYYEIQSGQKLEALDKYLPYLFAKFNKELQCRMIYKICIYKRILIETKN